ncbi:MAG: SDR family NAD(P)-dependent oxidoreductase, partial [Gammaproteobacteria bacterium]
AFIYLSDKNEEKEKITYLQLDTKARAIAAYLQQHAQPGDRIVLCYLPGIEFISAFLACLYAGMIAVPAYPLRNNHHAQRLMTILNDCHPKLILGTKESLLLMQQQTDFAACQFVYSEDIPDELALEHRKVILKANDIAFLQYTSGSTGHPKGVMVTHGNLMHNEKCITYGTGLSADKKILSWMPFQHDFGLIGNVLQSIYIGSQTILLSPTILTENPLAWLQAITKYKPYYSGGPNFAYETCIKRINESELESLDLSCWDYALCAAEPIRAETLQRFTDKFKVCGFRAQAFAPAYGLAESTLCVSTKRPQQEYKILAVSSKQLAQGKIIPTNQAESNILVVGCGDIYLKHEVLIVDPQTRMEAASDQIGEVWIKSKSVAAGYWQKEQETSETFQAKLIDGRGPYLRTGDLGFIQHKELFITGRLKDLIIQNGRNIYPQDIETATENSHPAIRHGCTAAFSVEVHGQEQIIVVAEVERTYRKIDFAPVFLAIRQALNNTFEVTPYSIQLLVPAKALRTTSGKIQRRATRELYLTGKLEILASDNLSVAQLHVTELTKDQIEQDISRLLAKILAMDQVDKNLSFSLLGGTSLHAVLFHEQLQKYVGSNLELSASIAFDYPTITSLADFLYEQLSGELTAEQSTAMPIFKQEPIAIIGVACRFPGKADSPEGFWQLLQQGREAVSLIPASRWNIDGYYDATDEDIDKTPIRHGAFIEDIDLFDANFFNISPREAESMDPQQRILLETVWHALESAGIEPSNLKNTSASVFIGATNHEYEDLLLKQNEHNSYIATGNNLSVLAGRVAYTLGLEGTCLTVDTACSSSLVAIHEACNSLQLGETNLAIVGAVNALLSPDGFINLARANMLAVDGHCKVFADNADGYVRGEGCGVIILKRLSEAKKDHDNILAVIKSVVVNQDGASSGLTVPNGVAQEKLLRQALMQAGLQPADIDYLEAHGTGTKLGDPMETHAISEVYHNSHAQEMPLVIGSVKGNIGHLEAAAGMAGLIKVILSLQNEMIPGQLHAQKINPNINLTVIPAKIPQQILSWKKSARLRRAGISSFGFSGTNAHIILEEAPEQDPSTLRPALPKTIFNRQRYWSAALDEALAKQWALSPEWFFNKERVVQPLGEGGKKHAIENCVLLTNSSVDPAWVNHVAEALQNSGIASDSIDEEELSAYLQTHRGCCVIDVSSASYLTSGLDDALIQTEHLFQRYQGWMKQATQIARWVIVNPGAVAAVEREVLFNISQILNWEYDFTTVYIELARKASLTLLGEELARGEEPVVYLGERREVERVVRADATALLSRMTGKLEPDEEGTYLITGGLGGLGFALLQELVAAGLKQIVLCSRHAPEEVQQAEIAQLNVRYAAQISHITLDISDKAAVQAWLAGINGLKGIFHLAGVEANAAFEEYTPEQLENILKPKLGAWNLHELTRDISLKYFVLFSSGASFMGSLRQGAYVIANGYLDALAQERKEKQLPVTHIQWGPWQGAGMAMNDSEIAKASADFIDLAKGMHLLKQLLCMDSLTGLGVIPPKYAEFRLVFHKHLPGYLRSLFISSNTPSVQGVFLPQYDGSPAERRLGLLQGLVEEQLREVLHLSTEPLDKEQGFFERGMDSLMAVELYNRLQNALGSGVALRPMMVFDYPSVEKLTGYLHDTLEGISKQIYMTGTHYEHEPIAVIGFDVRFPGGANDSELLWEHLLAGQDATRLADKRRWDSERYPYRVGFVDDIDAFDADFFNISAREAEQLDPQQRMLLEVTWHALEASGINPRDLKETDTGVFLGISQSDYGVMLAKTGDKDFYQATGNALNAAAGRLAYTLGLQGPCLAIDTACSSSLVALHEACRSLENHETGLAIAAGVNAVLAPETFEVMIHGNMLSEDGACKTFDKDANGYVRGEGCGVVVVKRLSDALRDNNKIYALIKGSAVNQDGASSGLTVPNGLAQEKVLAQALANANVQASDVDYIEAHGTGTPLGDPIEIGAIKTIYGQDRTSILTIGTIKTNIGHLESAAGIAGVIKTILALQHEAIPKHLHFKEINPAIHLEDIPAQLPLQTIEWKKQANKTRRAGISSFGFSGTNAHLILEEAPEQDPITLRPALPKTVFNRQLYWFKSSPQIPLCDAPDGHPFLQHKVDLPESQELYFESEISTAYPEFIADHLIYDYPVVAGADYLSLALTLAQNYLDARYIELSQVEFIEALVLSGASTRLLVKVSADEDNRKKVTVYSRAPGQDAPQLRANLKINALMAWAPSMSLAAIQATFPAIAAYSGAMHIAKAKELSLTLGHHFQWLESVWVKEGAVLAQMRLADEPVETRGYLLYPGLIDSCFQSLLAVMPEAEDTLSIPFTIDAFCLDAQGGAPRWVYGKVQQGQVNEANIRTDFSLFNASGVQIGQISGFVTQKVLRKALERALHRQSKAPEYFYNQHWEEWLPQYQANTATAARRETIYDARTPNDTAVSLKTATRLLAFLQAELAKAPDSPAITIITEQAYALQNEAIQLNQAQLNGLIKTAILEHPELHLRQLDVSAGEEIAPLVDVLAQDDSQESLFGYRDGHWYVERIERHVRQETETEIPLDFDKQGTYLVTGGLGGLGLVLARYLAEHGAGRIVLVSRHLPDEPTEKIIESLQSAQIQVLAYQADISDKNQVKALIKYSHARAYPLKGIFHLAGVIADAPLEKQTAESFATVFAPKALGAWYLHEVTQANNITLTHFVGFSSIASLQGSLAQSNYAVANGFLDGLMQYRHQLGLAAQSLNWGPWREVGMAHTLVVAHTRLGFIPLKTADALKALSYSLSQPVVQLGIMQVDSQRVRESLGDVPSWLSTLIAPAGESALLLHELQTAQPEQREGLLKAALTHEVRKVLGISRSQPVSETVGFFEMGMDSLMAVEIRNRLQALLGTSIRLSTTWAFENPTIEKMTQMLLSALEFKALALPRQVIVQATQEPMAIIGMACRFPHGADSLDAFWDILQRGEDCVDEIPASRWEVDRYYSADVEAKDKMYTRKGAFLANDIRLFDAAFFNISPKEAELMDPQQRLLLEVVWEALEDAGIEAASLRERAVGFFLGQMNHDYMGMLQEVDEMGAYVGSGNAPSAAAGRVSYVLGLQGPCLAIDTACSSSLVALNSAIQSMREGESEIGIVAGVNLMLSPKPTIQMCQAKMLSPEGHCKTFDEAADGYTRGEGCGVLVLKPLSKALRDHDRVWAVVRGSGVNEGGPSAGLTVPNAQAQEKVIRFALAKAGLQPEDMDYIEAHGTGTKLGDPIEIRALTQVFGGRANQQEKALVISSVKTYMGHLESAAGMAGIIRTVLSMRHGWIPKHLHLKHLNPAISLEPLNALIPVEGAHWPQTGQPKRAGVSSFGFSGINAHVILEEAPLQDPRTLREALPKTVFNRQRYWSKALDERNNSLLALPKNWFFSKEFELQPLLSYGQALPNYHYVVLIDEASDKDLIIALEQEFNQRNIVLHKVVTSELATYLPQYMDCCVIDMASDANLNPTENMDICLHETLNLVGRYQSWLKFAEHLKRWVVIKYLSPDNIHQHSLLNITQIINWEYNVSAVYIELGTQANISSLTDEIGLGTEPYVQLNKERHIERIIPKDITAAFNQSLEPFCEDTRGYYLITGGLGGLGFELAKMLLNAGIKNIVLCSRTHPNFAKQQEIASLADHFSAKIVHYALDISDRIAVKNMLDDLPLLTGIFNLAGNAVNAPFDEYNAQQLENILKPKLAAWTLHELTQQMPIKYFVLFSSISSLFGSNRLGAYVLSNGYLDSLALLRKHQGLPIIHVQWGPWQDAGMASYDTTYDTGLDQNSFIKPQSGMQLLRQLLSQQAVTGLGVVSPNYLQFMLSFHRHLPEYLQGWLAIDNKSAANADFIQQYYNSSQNTRYPMLLTWVQKILRDVLQFKDSQEIDSEKGFFEMGMDSLMAVEVYEHIHKTVGNSLALRPMLVFDYPSIAKLTAYLYSALEKQTKQIIVSSENYQHEPIAVIGLEARFPGAQDIDHFWQELIEAKDAIQMVDASRWDPKLHPYQAGFIAGIDLFDANFFNISAREAEQLDPQQRILLETTWHAIERAGIDPLTLKDTDTGVFIGISQSDYQQLLEDTKEVDFYQATGNALNVAAGRISYILGLQGPAMAIDTACSSSLVALHEACRSLEQRECNMAIAAGVNALLTPKSFAILNQGNMLAKDGYCKTFDKDADGYVRGEGCGVVILKRLSDALRDQDKIYALIKGSAVNQDGASSGLTVPNGIAQEKVLAKALANANLQPHEVDYIEAHGTGTHLGDPIEIGAIQTIYSQQRQVPLTIGTVKTNIGHLESAAGIAGIIKTILALQHEMIPQHLHFKEINPAIHLADIPAQIPLQAIPWQRQSQKIRYAGVSSFGFSGTNVHVILAEAPLQDETKLRDCLPKTLFKRQRYWLKSSPTQKSIRDDIGFKINATAHPFLQHQVEIPGSEDIYFESIIDLNYPEFIADHLVHGYVVVAGSTYISAALSIAKDSLHARACKLTRIEFIEAFVLDQASQLNIKVMK